MSSLKMPHKFDDAAPSKFGPKSEWHTLTQKCFIIGKRSHLTTGETTQIIEWRQL